MKKFIFIMLFFTFAVFLGSNANAMSSANYRLDWFTPLTGGAGGVASSTNYAVNLTVGQTVIGSSSSTNYGIGLGYWYGVTLGGRLYLPVIMR
jgi:hypothetical protein